MPTNMEIYTCNVDGSDMKKVTRLGGANWAPFFSRMEKGLFFPVIMFRRAINFNLWMCNLDGSDLEQITL